ncbi:MAG: serine/threonine protein kinase [Scytolyngbya sp. HA4215-MV1]|jgi:serine/threonine protein kinase|nr:serine/threonine protein kinase [Scytolyngbya sp. HA4215-MV1]
MINLYNLAQVSFELKTEIGQEGKNSSTYIADDHQLGAEIVIKKIEKQKLDSVDAFFNESKILYLSSHPNVVQIHYACQDDDNIYIAMPYYKNGSLNSLINSRFLTIREIVVFGCQIASGLHNIHSKKLIHFDIKPDNILLSDRGEALISDFGLAKHADLFGKASQDRMYFKMLPPEALNGSEFTVLFDIYQLGLTLYRMCNGNQDFYTQFNQYGITPSSFNRDGFRFDVRNGRFPNRSIFLEHVPERLRRIIRKCLEPEPNRRYHATIEVANALAEIDGKTLDWQFSQADSKKSWTKLVDGREYTLSIASDNTSLATKATSSGRATQIREYCKHNLTPKDIKNFLGDY